MKTSSEYEIYKEFFVNVAVAWFSAGVIAPLFVIPIGLRGLMASAISIFASFAFLRIAVMLKNKYD